MEFYTCVSVETHGSLCAVLFLLLSSLFNAHVLDLEASDAMSRTLGVQLEVPQNRFRRNTKCMGQMPKQSWALASRTMSASPENPTPCPHRPDDHHKTCV